MMDIPSTFLRWALRERPDMVDKHPGLREYIETRIGAEGCARSATRDARDHAPRGQTPSQLGIARRRGTPAPARNTPPPAPEQPAQMDFSTLASRMREAAETGR